MFLILYSGPGGLSAQSDPPSPNVFHVYVDPLYGDDGLASQWNPVGNSSTTQPNRPVAFSLHPQNWSNQNPTGFWKKHQNSRIQHAPYPFKTLNAAMRYIRAEFVNNNRVNYFKDPTTGQYRIKRVLVHCLPGIYAPLLPNEVAPVIDPKSGLPYNGEKNAQGGAGFPIQMIDGVSIQGTSALDTIFDARGDEGNYAHVFEFNSNGTTVPTFEDSFIDGITIRNARSSSGTPFPAGTAIAITGISKIYCRVSNCILAANHVGIVITCDTLATTTLKHSPILVNLTLAGNMIGIWSGPNTTAGQAFGYSIPRILNCVIDRRDLRTNPLTQLTSSAFEGLHPDDFTVQSVNANPVNLDFNAYDQSRHTGLKPPGWNLTSPWPRGFTPPARPTYNPRVDLTPYVKKDATHDPGNTVLWVNDALRRFDQATTIDTSRSPHDYRLSPTSYDASNAGPSPNPLVNKGYHMDSGFSPGIQFKNGAPVIKAPPGLSSGAEYLARIDAWDWDCEGFGNPRVETRSAFGAPPAGSTAIDLGADECGEIGIAGYIDGTRIFSRFVPGRSQGWPGGDNTQMFFFDLYTQGNSFDRPVYNTWTQGAIEHQGLPWSGSWWNYLQSVPVVPNPYMDNSSNPSRSSDFIQGNGNVIGSWRYAMANQGNSILEGFMRNLECDFSPHLLPDIHPAWGTMHWNPPTPGWSFQDAFAANPWYHSNDAGQLPDLNDNPFVYFDLTEYFVVDATLNPPGTDVSDPAVGRYLAQYLPTQTFGPFGYSGAPLYSVGTLGLGDVAPGPDLAPDSFWYGVRYCLQRDLPPDPGPTTNLQTFLVVNGEAQSMSQGYRSPPRVKYAKRPTEAAFAKDYLRRSRLLQKIRNQRK